MHHEIKNIPNVTRDFYTPTPSQTVSFYETPPSSWSVTYFFTNDPK